MQHLVNQVRERALYIVFVIVSYLFLASCQIETPTATQTPVVTPLRTRPTPTLQATATLPFPEQPVRTYAHGELLPDMRVPIQRSERGEGGWYVIIGTKEGWAQFLSQMGQPTEIWEPVSWDQEILVGALLGVRSGRGHAITITEMDVEGMAARATVSIVSPQADQSPSSWVAYPFHFVRVSRQELLLGPVTFEFVSAESGDLAPPGQMLISHMADMVDLNILWLPGEEATYPTPTPPPSTSTPVPLMTPTPVPNLQLNGTVLEVISDALTLRLLPAEGNWTYVDLMEATSILFADGQPATLAQLLPGTTISVLGYEGEGGTMRAAHVDVLRLPPSLGAFATYRPRDTSLSTLYDGYALPLSADSISSTHPLTQTFSPTQTRVLTQSGFVVSTARYPSFATLYTDARYVAYPAFISADSVLHSSGELFDRVLHSTERAHLLPELRMLDQEMYDLSWSQYEAMRNSTTLAAQRIAVTALRNAAYFAVPLSLLDPAFTVPTVISPVVHAELSLITASKGITISPLLDLPGIPGNEKAHIDYAQFAPAEHYVHDPALARYFQALNWHHTVAFRPTQREEMLSAALIAYTLYTHPTPRVLWQRIYDATSFFHGQDASFTPLQYGNLIALIWGEGVEIGMLADQEGMDALVQAAQSSPLPENPIWTFWDRDGLADRSWRFLGSPFRIDAYIFQQTTGERVGDDENRRTLPSIVDLATALGSLESYRVADQVGETAYANYLDRVGKVRNELSALQPSHWTADLYWNWLYTYRDMLQEKTPSYPEWTRTTAWKRKELQTVFGSWTDTRHDIAARGATTSGQGEAGERTSPSEPIAAAPWGYVEPQPAAYGRLAAAARLLIDGLEDRMMLTNADRAALLELENWLIFMQDVARRELTGQVLSAEEYQRLGQYASWLQALDLAAVDGGTLRGDTVPVLVRAAEDGTEQLIQATGWVDEIYVVVERDRKRYLARGGVYSYYEFIRPLEDALTDTSWQEMLIAVEQPTRPVWVQDFIPE